jgi:choline-sulfatase
VHLFDVHEWQAVAARELDGSVAELHGPGALHGDALLERLVRDHGVDLDALRAGTPHGAAHLIDAYDSQIRVVDGAVRRLYDALCQTKVGSDALWIVTADHGEGLGSHRYAGHGRYVYNEQIRVPLLVHSTSDRVQPQVRDELVRHIDLLPTILDLIDRAGTWGPPPSADPTLVARSFVPLLEGSDSGGERRAYAERRPLDQTTAGWEPGDVYALQDPRAKLIRHTEGANEYFDLAGDPGERVNRADANSDVQNRIRALADRQVDLMRRQAERIRSGHVDPSHLEELEQLGYLGKR